jgi:alkaline phosphatase
MILKLFFVLITSCSILFAQEVKPKNIIIFIGDGMGLNYVSANLFTDEDSPFLKFTTTGLSITSSTDNLITDSGASATAISTGHRTYNLAIGVDTAGNKLTNIMETARRLGKSTGIAATSSVTHATPAAFAAHVADRKMEIEIAEQMVSSGTDVVIGGGLSFFTSVQKGGRRESGNDLTGLIRSGGYDLLTSIDELKSFNKEKPFYALLEMDALKPAGKRNYELKDLVAPALEYLSKDEDGFILMVEGSQIDWAAHDHLAEQIMKEMSDFAGALNTALDFAEEEGNTLVLVTSDHETGGGSIVKGNPDGTDLQLKFTSGSHTPGLVGIFAKGPGEEEFTGVMRISDIGQKLFKLLE